MTITPETTIQSALKTLWFDKQKSDQLVFLSLEETMLEFHGIVPEQFYGEICAQAMSDLDLNKPKDLLFTIRRKVAKWQVSGDKSAPPILAVVALTILAAKQMTRDQSYSAAAYYPRLAHLLGRPDLASHLSNGFDDFVGLWRTLHIWINRTPGLGKSSITSLGGFSKIGYPRSQVVITQHDLSRFSSLAIRFGIRNLQNMSDHQLIDELRKESYDSACFSPALSSCLEGRVTEVEDLIASTFRSVAEAPDVYEKTIFIEKQAELWFDFDSEELSWVVPSDERFESFEGKDKSGNILKCSSGAVEQIFSTPFLDDMTISSLEIERTWVRDEKSIKIEPRRYWLFNNSESPNCIISTKSLRIGEKYSLLVREKDYMSLLYRFDLCLEQELDTLKIDVIENWKLIPDLPYQSRTRILNYLTGMEFPTDLEPERVELKLSNGLDFKSISKNTTYVKGFEPDLIMSITEGSIEITLEDARISQKFKANGTPIPLSLLPFKNGSNHININGRNRLNIRVADRSEVWNSAALAALSDNSAASDGLLDFRLKPLANRSRYHFMIYRDASIEEVSYLSQPQWLVRRGVRTSFSYFEIDIPEAAIWHVSIHDTRGTIAKRLSDRSIHLDAESVIETASTWEALLQVMSDSSAPELEPLIQTVKGVL